MINHKLCSRCHQYPSRPGRKCCERCLNWTRDRRAMWKRRGLCTQCGHSLGAGSRLSCSHCLLIYRTGRLRRLGLPELEIEKAKLRIIHFENICDSCGTNDPGGRHEWCLDHDEVRKIFRGIICCGCNSAIGHLHDSPEKLEKAAQYLRRS